MDFYGFTEEQFNRMISLFKHIGVTGMDQIDDYHEAITILRHPTKFNVKEEVKEDAN